MTKTPSPFNIYTLANKSQPSSSQVEKNHQQLSLNHNVADSKLLWQRRAKDQRLRPVLPRPVGPIPGLPAGEDHRGRRRDGGGVGERAHRLEGDAGGARVQGGPSGSEEGGGEGGDRGREGAA